jgi:glycosyltransferase involved in cell wall biosynthesis
MRPRLLIISWPDGLAGPQCGLKDLRAQSSFTECFELSIWRPGDVFRGLHGKWKLLRAVKQQLDLHKPHVVLIDHDASLAFWLLIALRLCGYGRIAVFAKSAIALPGMAWLRRLKTWVIDRLSRQRIAISTSAARAMYGRIDGVHYLPCGIDFTALRRQAEQALASNSAALECATFRFACIGRLSPEKQQELLIRAMSLLPSSAATLLLMGEGGDEARLKQMVVDLKLEDRVRVLGARSDIAVVYGQEVDAVLIPSKLEAQCRVAAEAQFFGLPIVVSPAVEDQALLRPNAALRVSEFSPQAWASAMASCLAVGRTQPKFDDDAEHSALSASQVAPRLSRLLADLASR